MRKAGGGEREQKEVSQQRTEKFAERQYRLLSRGGGRWGNVGGCWGNHELVSLSWSKRYGRTGAMKFNRRPEIEALGETEGRDRVRRVAGEKQGKDSASGGAQANTSRDGRRAWRRGWKGAVG